MKNGPYVTQSSRNSIVPTTFRACYLKNSCYHRVSNSTSETSWQRHRILLHNSHYGSVTWTKKYLSQKLWLIELVNSWYRVIIIILKIRVCIKKKKIMYLWGKSDANLNFTTVTLITAHHTIFFRMNFSFSILQSQFNKFLPVDTTICTKFIESISAFYT